MYAIADELLRQFYTSGPVLKFAHEITLHELTTKL
jgi:hypothetical protein